MKSAGSTLLFGAVPAHLKLSPSEKRKLLQFVGTLSANVSDGRSFVCLISNDRDLHRLNREFLGNDYPTDVLSFPSHSSIDGLGEIAISIECAATQARDFGHALIDEICLLMLHGLLHLTGHDHENDNGEMARTERSWRAKLALPKTLIERLKAEKPPNVRKKAPAL